MTHFDVEKQNEMLNRLRDELSRLNQKFDETKKTLNIPANEEVTLPEGDLPPQLAAAMKAAEDEARKAGRNAAAALSCECTSSPRGTPTRLRRGAIAI